MTSRPFKEDLPLASTSEMIELVAQFEGCVLPYKHWTHRAHIAVGLSYLSQLPFDQALEKARKQIQLYNQKCGDPEGYNETITLLFLKRIARTLSLSANNKSLAEILSEMIQEYPIQWVYSYYSKERVWSKEAKDVWLEPDLQALDF